MRTLIFLLLPLFSISQGHKINFIEYSDVLHDLKIHKAESKYFKSLDYESMIYLDKACIKELLMIMPNLFQERLIDTIEAYSTKPKVAPKKIQTGETSIRKFILLREKTDVIFTNPSDIYEKDDKIAVFTSFGKETSTMYRLTLIDGYARVEELYTDIE